MGQVCDLVITVRIHLAVSALGRILGLADVDLAPPGLTSQEKLARIATIVRETLRSLEAQEATPDPAPPAP